MNALFQVARVFGVIPLSKIGLNQRFSVTKIARLFSLVVQSGMALVYLKYCYTKYLASQSGSQSFKTKITSATSVINYSLDQLTVWSVIILSQQFPTVTNKIFKNFSFVDKTLQQSKYLWPKVRLNIMILMSTLMFLSKNISTFFVGGHISLLLLISSRFIYIMIIVAELIIVNFCLDIKYRFKNLNEELKSQNTCLNKSQAEKLHFVFRALDEIHSKLAASTRKILLFDLSQILMMILSRSLNICIHCFAPEDNESKSSIWCFTQALYVADCIWRFCMIICSCGTLQNEVTIRKLFLTK